jgi:chromosomal replication initiator protein
MKQQALETAYLSPKSAEVFLLLKENRFAFAAIRSLLRTEMPTAARVVYVYGPSGVGKSHLVRQFLRETRRMKRPLQPALFNAREFAYDGDTTPTPATTDELDEQLQGLFVCEDVGHLENRFESQRRFITMLDNLRRSGGRCLLTGSNSPAGLRNMLPRLVSRLHGGVCAAVKPPDCSSRARLVAHFACTHQIPLPAEVSQLIAEAMPVSPRELLATLMQLDVGARLRGLAIDTGLARRLLAGDVKPPPVTLPQIARAVARQFGVSVSALRSPKRSPAQVLARHCAMLLAREMTDESLLAIASYFGRSNHGSVAHACNRMKKLLPDNPALRQQLTLVRQELGSAGLPGNA